MTVTLALRCPRYTVCASVCVLRPLCVPQTYVSDERTRRVENSTAILLPQGDDSLRKTPGGRLSFSRLFIAHHDRFILSSNIAQSASLIFISLKKKIKIKNVFRRNVFGELNRISRIKYLKSSSAK